MIEDPAQFACFDKIVSHESGWNDTATNSSSGAYGLVQALPASKMASAGGDWKTNPATQIKWGLDYMNDRYGSPVGAWTFWQSTTGTEPGRRPSRPAEGGTLPRWEGAAFVVRSGPPRSGRRLQPLDDRPGRQPAARAHRDQRELLVPALQFMQGRGDQPGARRADRVAERDARRRSR